jgi:hypothetical protein
MRALLHRFHSTAAGTQAGRTAAEAHSTAAVAAAAGSTADLFVPSRYLAGVVARKCKSTLRSITRCLLQSHSAKEQASMHRSLGS